MLALNTHSPTDRQEPATQFRDHCGHWGLIQILTQNHLEKHQQTTFGMVGADEPPVDYIHCQPITGMNDTVAESCQPAVRRGWFHWTEPSALFSALLLIMGLFTQKWCYSSINTHLFTSRHCFKQTMILPPLAIINVACSGCWLVQTTVVRAQAHGLTA